MVLQIYTLGDNCEHCIKLIEWLEQRGIKYNLVDLTKYSQLVRPTVDRKKSWMVNIVKWLIMSQQQPNKITVRCGLSTQAPSNRRFCV